MTDTHTLAPDAASILATLSPGAKAQGLATLRNAGFTVEEAVIATAKPGDVAKPVTSKTSIINQSADLIAVDKQQAAWQNLYDNGTLDKAMVIEEAKKAGFLINVHGAAPQAAVAPEAVKDAALSGPKEGASAYHLQYENAGDVAPDELAAFDGEVRTMFAGLQLPVFLAQPTLTGFLQSAAQFPEDMKPEALQLRLAEEGVRVRRLGDHTELARLANLGQEAIKKVAPALHADLYERHAFHTAEGFNGLVIIGRILDQRTKSNGK